MGAKGPVKLKVIFSDELLLAAHRDTITAQTYYTEGDKFVQWKKKGSREPFYFSLDIGQKLLLSYVGLCFKNKWKGQQGENIVKYLLRIIHWIAHFRHIGLYLKKNMRLDLFNTGYRHALTAQCIHAWIIADYLNSNYILRAVESRFLYLQCSSLIKKISHYRSIVLYTRTYNNVIHYANL